MLDLATHAPHKITPDYESQFVKLVQVSPEKGLSVMSFFFDRLTNLSSEICGIALAVANRAHPELTLAPSGGRIIHLLYNLSSRCPNFISESSDRLGETVSKYLDSTHGATLKTAYQFLCNLALSPTPFAMQFVISHFSQPDMQSYVCQLLSRAPIVPPSKELLNTLLMHADEPLAWALIARMGEMPGGGECLIKNTEWVIDSRIRESLGIFLILARNPTVRDHAYALGLYPTLIARAAAVPDDYLITALPFLISQGPLTAELLGLFLSNGFWQSFLDHAMRSQTPDVQRMAMYLVTLFLPVGWIDLFGTYLGYAIQWMNLPDIASEVLNFIIACSVYSQAVKIIAQVGLVEYFEALADDPNFGPIAQTFLANVAQHLS
jgi:hypothetical protein